MLNDIMSNNIESTNNELFKRLVQSASDGFNEGAKILSPIQKAVSEHVIEPVVKAVSQLPQPSPEPTVVQTNPSGFSWKWGVFILVCICLFGYPIFTLMATGSRDLNSILAPFLKLIGYFTFETTKGVLNGTKTGADVVLGSAVNGINYVEGKAGINTHPNAAPVVQEVRTGGSQLVPNIAYDNGGVSGTSSGKSGKGWCYIGVDQSNVRGCMELGDSQKCNSGMMFDSKEQCINPNLRG